MNVQQEAATSIEGQAKTVSVDGKTAYADKTSAVAAMLAASRRFNDWRMSTYVCEHCKLWHYGH